MTTAAAIDQLVHQNKTLEIIDLSFRLRTGKQGYAHGQLLPGGLIASGGWTVGAGIRDYEQMISVARSR
jgi:hypothetical protein